MRLGLKVVLVWAAAKPTRREVNKRVIDNMLILSR